jgi:hypothetical protein
MDYDELERWTRVGYEGGTRSRKGASADGQQIHKCPAVLTTNTRQFQEQRVNGTGQSAGPDEFGCHVAQLCVGSL